MFLLSLKAGIDLPAAALLSVAVFYLVAVLVAWASTPLIEARAVSWSSIGAAYAQRMGHRRRALLGDR